MAMVSVGRWSGTIGGANGDGIKRIARDFCAAMSALLAVWRRRDVEREDEDAD